MEKLSPNEEWVKKSHQRKNNEDLLTRNSNHHGHNAAISNRPAFTGQDLVNLGSICSKIGPRTPDTDDFQISAIYTYFGQFIAHDMLDVSDSHQKPAGDFGIQNRVRNKNTRPLTLTTVYKDRIGVNDRGMFRSRKDGKRTHDLPRDIHGKAEIPDQRNDQNLLIAQFHKLWLNYHNKLVLIDGLSFEQAKEQLLSTFLYLIKYDFLKQIMWEPIWDLYFSNPGVVPSINLYTTQDDSLIPSPFHAAAFRIGHGMVRESYAINASNTIKLENLFRITNNSCAGSSTNANNCALRIANNEPLMVEHQINWAHFLDKNKAFVPSGNVNFNVPHIAEDNIPLVTRNMRRAHDFGVADAQSYIQAYNNKFPEIQHYFKYFSHLDEYLFAGIPGRYRNDPNILNKDLLIESTPLWFYIQREAAHLFYLKSSAESDFNQKRGVLGPLGSLMVGQVFFQFLGDVSAGFNDISTISELTKIADIPS